MEEKEIREAIDGHQFTFENAPYVLRITQLVRTTHDQIVVRFAIDGSHSGELGINPEKWGPTEITEIAEETARNILSGEMPPGVRELL